MIKATALLAALAARRRLTATTVRRLVAACGALGALAGCGGDDDRLTVYLPQQLGPDGPPGQIALVLTPVRRDRRAHMSTARQAVLELRVGPSPAERAHGFVDPLEPGTRLRAATVRGSVATVDLAGREPSVLGAAAIVYSVTDETGARVVRLRLDGRGCCAYGMHSRPVRELSRMTFRGWTGEPCGARTWPGAVRCRSGED